MKKIYLIGGPMGVGKTTICKRMLDFTNDSCYLDGDWCWTYNEKIFLNNQKEMQEMVINNICFILNNYLKSDLYENIYFCWVLHLDSIYEDIISKLSLENTKVIKISLVCCENELKERLLLDINRGIRASDVIERSMNRLKNYIYLKTIKIDTTNKDIDTICNEINKLGD